MSEATPAIANDEPVARAGVRDAAARGITPLGFALALLCFLFAFNAVSCNTDAAKQTLQTAAGFTGGQTNVGALDSCLDSLKGVSLFSYSGINLAFGSAPSAVGTSQLPAACHPTQSGLNPASTPPATQASIGVQPLALLAFVACIIGLLVGAALLLWPRRMRFALPVAALLAVAALVALIVDQSRVQSLVLTRIDALAAGSGAPFSLAGYFTQSSGIAYFLALVALGIVALVTLARWVLVARPEVPRARAPD